MEATSLDWNPVTNKIVSGSIDRSVFVWKYVDEEARWKPEFVNLDEKLSVIDISWAKQGHKFVVGTSSKCMYMVYDDPKQTSIDWNSSIMKSKFESSIVSCSFDPTARVIAAASFDGTCKVLSAFKASVDTEEAKGPFGDVDSFGVELAVFKCQFWLNSV